MPRGTDFRTAAPTLGFPAAFTAGLLTLSVGCAESGPAGRAANVLFVSIDTLRADHVGCYGHPRASTPGIDRLATEGTRFETCISSCPLTLPSHATMMTGTYPFVHGARANVAFVLDDENLTLAEILREAGYATHAEVAAAVLDSEFGLDQGFDGYVGPLAEGPDARTRMGANATDRGETERSAREVTDAALAYLESRRGAPQPFFLFVHYYDPHQPYEAPEPFASAAGGGYLAEVAYTDEQLGRLLEGLAATGFAEHTLVVLTSDHGDGFQEHGELTHGSFLYDSTLCVPLVLRWPGRITAGQVAAAQVGLVDLLPTLLELLDLASPGDLQGTSLVPLLEAPQRDLGLATYSETVEPRVNFGYAQLRALRRAGWKYIHGPTPELYEVARDRAELDDRAPAEADRLAGMRAALRELIADAPALLGRGALPALDPENVRRLAALGYASGRGPNDDGGPQTWTDELAHFEPEGANPMDRADVIFLLYTGLGKLRDDDYTGAVEHLADYLGHHPEHAEAHSYLGQALALAGRQHDAVSSLRRALELDPSRCSDNQILGSLLAESGDRPGAREHFELALECDPEDALSAFNLGKLLLLVDEPEAALSAFDRALELVPEYAPTHFQRARALRELARDDEAVASLARALELEPDEPGHRLELAALLVELGEGARALAVLESGLRSGSGNLAMTTMRLRILATDPDAEVRDGERARRIAARLLAGEQASDPRVLAAAATALAEGGEFEQAIRLAQRALEAARARDAWRLVERVESELAGYRAGRPVQNP